MPKKAIYKILKSTHLSHNNTRTIQAFLILHKTLKKLHMARRMKELLIS